MQINSGNLTIKSRLYEIVIHSQQKPQITQIKSTPYQDQYARLLEEKRKVDDDLAKVSKLLEKQREIGYIMQGYFAKIERIMYNSESHLFDEPLLDYEKAELHMREIVRRLADIHNQKLNSVPVIYRSNAKVYRQTTNKK